MPGGDACDSECGGGGRFENQDAVLVTPNDSSGVEQVLANLDLVSVLMAPTDADEILQDSILDPKFRDSLLVSHFYV